MRVAELLAIVVICPLAFVGSGCRPIDQPIGQYSAASTRPSPNSAGAANTASSGTQTVSSGSARVMDAGAGSFDDFDPADNTLPVPILPRDGSSNAEPAASGSGRPVSVPREMCYTGSNLATRKRLDMYLVMDANVTLPYSGAWEVATTGVRMFVQDRAAKGIGVGLRYYGSECEAEPYASEPTVEIGELPGNEDALVAGTMMPADYTASPMAFALRGGIRHQTQRAKEHPDWKQIVVLITDGFTQDLTCRYSLQDVQDIALDGFNSDPSIETYVIGFGAPDTMSTIGDEVLARFSVLNSVARDGGSTRAASVKFNDDPEDMHDALTLIRRTAQPCAYDFPSNYDPALLNLSILPGSFVPRVDNRAACGPTAQGFFYMPEAADTPSSVELCPASCLRLQLGDFDALFYKGCATVRP